MIHWHTSKPYSKMSERGRGGLQCSACIKCNNNHGHSRNYTGTTSNAKPKQGLSTALRDHIYNFCQKGSADKLKTLWGKLVQYVRTTYSHDISNELQIHTTVVLVKPLHNPAIMIRQAARKIMVCVGQATMQAARHA